MGDFKEFDENDCLQFIRQRLSSHSNEIYSDDDILFIVDFIWDYYEQNGMLSLNDLDADDEMLDNEDLIAWCRQKIKKTPDLHIEDADVPVIVKGELDYEESLENIF